MKYTGPLIDETEDDQPRGVKREAETPFINDRHGFQPAASFQVHEQPSPAFQQLTTRHITIGDPTSPHSIRSYIAPSLTSSSQPSTSGAPGPRSSPAAPSQPSSATSSSTARSTSGAGAGADAALASTESADGGAGAERVFGSLEEALAAFRDQVVGCFRFGRLVGLANVEMGWAVDQAMRVALPGWLEDAEEGAEERDGEEDAGEYSDGDGDGEGEGDGESVEVSEEE